MPFVRKGTGSADRQEGCCDLATLQLTSRRSWMGPTRTMTRRGAQAAHSAASAAAAAAYCSSWLVVCWLLLSTTTTAAPLSKPYIAFRTDPLDQSNSVHHILDYDSSDASIRQLGNNKNRIIIHKFDAIPAEQCPLQFSLGLAQKMHYDASTTPGAAAIRTSPVLATAFPARGPGKQVIYNYYEHVDLLTPVLLMPQSQLNSNIHAKDPLKSSSVSDPKLHNQPKSKQSSTAQQKRTSTSNLIITEALQQPPDFPLLLESSAFYADPILMDVNADGSLDIVSADYDGGITITGTALMRSSSGGTSSSNQQQQQRYFHHTQVPRLYIRREWLAAAAGYNVSSSNSETDNSTTTTTRTIADPYHSYFEYYYHDTNKDELIRGVPANVLQQSESDATARRQRQQPGAAAVAQSSRKLLEQLPPPQQQRRRLQEEEQEQQVDNSDPEQDDIVPMMVDETDRGTDDLTQDLRDVDTSVDDYEYERRQDLPAVTYDDYTGGYEGDDMYAGGYNQLNAEYYHDKHYLRVTPHILTSPVWAEVPRQFGQPHERDDILMVAVSYYLDEDEYDGLRSYRRFQPTDVGDETEAQRGSFVASAIMGYIYSEYGSSGRWAGQTHLDLSTDYTAPENATVVGAVLPERSDVTRMGAFALSTPTVADLDGDGSPEVVVGTSMGMLYALDARNILKREHWPVQVKRPIEHRILVEDVVGNTNLEVFVADIGGNVYCLNHQAQLVWRLNWLTLLNLGEEESSTVVTASSPITLGDVNLDGQLDLIQVLRINNKRTFVLAVTAATGEILPQFPIELDSAVPPQFPSELEELHQKLAQPLVVDLHVGQTYVTDYLRRNGTHWEPRPASTATNAPHGGRGSGLHIVQPHGEDVFIIEGFTGCTQKISMGEQVLAMVQVDDVHGTQRLDLVVATESGRLVTLESPAPYHPLNTWTGGQLRSHRAATHAHGYSASQGIFVHSVSRQFVDIFGVYVPVTFEIFDNRPGVATETDKRKYMVEIRDGPSWRRVLWRNEYKEPGVYTDRVYIRYGPGYYTLSVTLHTSHGIIYEDQISIGYNVRFLDGFGILLWLPLLVASIGILLCGSKRTNWDDEDDDATDDARDGHRFGILGRAPLPT